MASHISKDVCPKCGGNYQRVAQHWALSANCNTPEIPNGLWDFFNGLYIIGGHFSQTDGSSGRFNFYSTDVDNTRKIKSILGAFSGKVLENDRVPSHVKGDFNTVHYIRTVRHPQMSREYFTKPDTITPIAAKTLLDFGLSHVEKGDYGRIAIRRDRLDYCLPLLEPFDIYVHKEHDSSVQYAVKDMDQIRMLAADSYPLGWWNERYLE